jgi:hypothetical protein
MLQSGYKRTRGAMTPPVNRMLQRKCACGSHDAGEPECDECARERKVLQRKATHAGTTGDSLPTVEDVLRSPAAPLDAPTRALVEPAFGHDFGHIRIHTDALAARSASELNARAYTVGRHVVFAAGQYAPRTEGGTHLLTHELTHTIQQDHAIRDSLRVADSPLHEREADSAADAVRSGRQVPVLGLRYRRAVARTPDGTEDAPKIERSFELDPRLFLKPMSAPAEREAEKCEEFPGGSTDCEVDPKTGTPTGKVKKQVNETNPCTRPCVEKHEDVHVKQMTQFCPELRKCYLAADAGKRSPLDCVKMAIFGNRERECEAYKVSVPCVEERIRTAKDCKSAANKEYGARKLASEKCFRDKNCGGA